MTDQWRELARSVHSVARPTVRIELLGSQYVVPNRMRGKKADRDYAVLRQLATGKRCIFDVGANLGATSLVMSTAMAADGQVVAFEASESASLNIHDVVQLNSLQGRVSVVNTVIAERSGAVLDFYWDHASGGASTVAGYMDHRLPIRKATLALDDFVDQTGMQPDLVKIDVEGAEAAVLRGARKMLLECRATVFVELHSWEGMTVVQNAESILADLPALQYQMVYLKTKDVVEGPAVLSGRGRCHVLLLADESADWHWLDSLDTSGL